jgi:hypothetical protein
MYTNIIKAVVKVSFFALIGLAMIITQSAMPLWALLLIPNKLHDVVKEKAEGLS